MHHCASLCVLAAAGALLDVFIFGYILLQVRKLSSDSITPMPPSVCLVVSSCHPGLMSNPHVPRTSRPGRWPAC